MIEDEEIIKRILKHLGLREIKARPSTRVTGPPKIQKYEIDYSTSQLPVSDNLSRASRSNEWLCVDPEYLKGYPASFFKLASGSDRSRVQGRCITFFHATVVSSTNIWPQPYLPHL